MLQEETPETTIWAHGINEGRTVRMQRAVVPVLQGLGSGLLAAKPPLRGEKREKIELFDGFKCR